MQNGRHYSRVLLFHSTRPDSPGGLGTKGRSESADTNTQHYTLHELDKISRLLVFITLSTTETPLNATVHIRLSTAEGGEKKKISKSDSVSQNYTQTKSKGRLLCSTAFLNRWHCKTTQFEFNSALFFCNSIGHNEQTSAVHHQIGSWWSVCWPRQWLWPRVGGYHGKFRHKDVQHQWDCQ